MQMHIRVRQEWRQTVVAVSGQPTLGQLCSLMQVLGADSPRWPTEAIFFDFSGVESTLAAQDHAILSAEAERWLPRMRLVTFRWRGSEDA